MSPTAALLTRGPGSNRTAGPAALVHRNYTVFRRGWLLFLTGFFEPVFYLFSIGVGVGAMVGGFEVGGRQIGYTDFVAPAMLATAAMNGAVMDSTFNVFFKLKFQKTYDAVLATPMGPRDVARGEIAWAVLRGAVYSAGFLLVMVAMGLVDSWWAVLALPAAVLTGFAFAAVGMALTTFMRSWQDFDLITLVVLPMFLFSTTFFPLSVYPSGLQVVVQCLPLYHAVELMRALTTGVVHAGLFGHLAYFAVMIAVGLVVAARRLDVLLLK